MFNLLLGGNTWATTLGYGHVGDVEVSWVWSSEGGGLDSLSFSLALPSGFTHPVLRQYGTVVPTWAGEALGTATIVDLDRDQWRFTAHGLYRRADDFQAETASGNPGSEPRGSVTRANSRGLGWGNPAALSNASISTYSEAQYQPNSIGALLNEYARLNQKRWGLDFADVPYMADDPSTATIALLPGFGSLATTDEDYVTRVRVRYVAGVDSNGNASSFRTAVATSTNTNLPPREISEDITSSGQMSSSLAQSNANRILAANEARVTFTEAVQPAEYQLTNLLGQPIPPWQPVHGQRLIQHGVFDSEAATVPGNTLDWVVGRHTWRQADNTVTLEPVNLAPRTVPKVIASLKTQREQRKNSYA